MYIGRTIFACDISIEKNSPGQDGPFFSDAGPYFHGSIVIGPIFHLILINGLAD